ncbi:UNVERIFIED_CONTAM: hypothetical protein RMT77_002737 [Armadillidium vulgare]
MSTNPSNKLEEKKDTMEGGDEGSEKTNKVSPRFSRVFNPPTLEKKHSSSDLLSRLKTRKILGVGETDNGDIHRSKISQVLGHNEHLYVKLPRGYWMAHLLLGAEITLEAFLFLFAPFYASSLFLLPLDGGEKIQSTQAARVTGAALVGLVVFIWALAGTTEKFYAKAVLSSLLTYHVICTLIYIATGLYREDGFWQQWIPTRIFIRLFLCLTCVVYLQSITSFMPTRGNRYFGNTHHGIQESKEY